MDSGNSGSLQSSSGGDEEYDSRAAAFISGSGTISASPPPPPPFFDPLSNFFNPNPGWQLRSGPNLAPHDNNMINPMLPSSSSFMPSFQPPSAGENSSCRPALAPLIQNRAAARNPKKRSRASRRAPTTVLTTDTTNFRAMVQEFTGIPSPPFSNSSFTRSRLDFFGTRSASFDAAQPPPYLRRPFPQKVQSHHSPLSSAIPASSPASNSAAVAMPTPYHLPITQNSNLFNIQNQNPLLSSLLQSNTKFPFSTSVIASKPSNSFEIPSNINNPHTDQQFSLHHGNHRDSAETLTSLPNLIPSDQNNNNAAMWNDNHDGNKDGDRVDLRPPNGNYKMSFPAPSMMNFNGGKMPESVGARGEGTVESWICSSD